MDWLRSRKKLDRYYTSGLRAEAILAWKTPWAGLLGGGDGDPCGPRPTPEPCDLTRLTLGQEIYTPNYLFDADPSSHDRPYAGWLYLEATAARVVPGRSTSLALEVGVTGEPSFAGPLHRWFHRSLDKHEPKGWESQIPFEPAFQLRYETSRAIPIGPTGGSASFDFEPRGSATLGTLRTGASAGLSTRLGWNAPSSLDWVGPKPGSPFFQLGMEANGELVLRDLFLDGNTWDGKAPARREPWIGRLRGRIQAGWGRFGIEAAVTQSTLEFRGQKGNHTYGTVRMIFRS